MTNDFCDRCKVYEKSFKVEDFKFCKKCINSFYGFNHFKDKKIKLFVDTERKNLFKQIYRK
jgi:hypothetical protein